jgi:hypothetical protein
MFLFFVHLYLISHKSACFSFLSIFDLFGYLEASSALLACAVQLPCALAVSFFFAGSPG